MPKLLMTDGTTRLVNYDKAANIFQVLTGKKEPEDSRQATFIETVASVEFDPLVMRKPIIRRRTPEHDQTMDVILADKSLTGINKARAVAKRLKDRVAA